MAISTMAARSWHRHLLLWIALPLAIVGGTPAQAEGLTRMDDRDLANVMESGGRGSGSSVAAQAIAPATGEGDRAALDGVVRFEPPTDDEIGETGSGATRSACTGVFALLPIGTIDPSLAQMFPSQRVNQMSVDRLDLFVYVSPIAPETNQERSAVEENQGTVRLLDLGLVESNAAIESFNEETGGASPSRRRVYATDGGYILRVSLATDPELEDLEHQDRQFDWFMNICPNADEVAIGQFGALQPLETPIFLGAETISEHIQQAATLANAGLWVDTLATLDDARRLATTPAETALVEANWISLFESIGWDFAAYPIAGVPVLTIEELEAQTKTIEEADTP